jgi:hypothetical protein
MLKTRKRYLLRRSLSFVLLVATFSFIAPIQPSTAAQDAECIIGSSSSCPATSPQEIYNIYGTTTDGTYWIKVGGTATRVYLLMNRSGSDNGAWVLMMKAAPGSKSFGYSSTYWTSSSSVLAEDSLSNDVSTDAKFSVFNTLTVSKMLAVFSPGSASGDQNGYVAGTYGIPNGGDISSNAFGGHVWLETLPSAQTAQTQMTTPRTIFGDSTESIRRTLFMRSSSDTPTYTSSSTSPVNQIFSYEITNGRYGFVNTACGNAGMNVRWGFNWNENPPVGNFTSCDAYGGIGTGVSAGGSDFYSAFDASVWPGSVSSGSYPAPGTPYGHKNLAFQIWGKVAEPSLAAPTSVAATVASSSQVNLSWAAPSGVTPTDYVVQYKPSGNAYTSAGSKSFLVSGQTTASITGLSSGTTYNFRVFARTGTNSTSDPSTSSVNATLKSSQTLSFSTTSYSKANGETQTVTATSAGTGLITYSAGASTACTVSGSTVTITASTGTCTITASRAADDIYLAADSTNSVSITVSKAVQATFTLTSTTAVFLTNLRLLTTGGSGPGAVSYSVSSSGTAGCAVSNGDSLTATSAGSCVVVATKATSTDYLAAYDTRTVTVSKAPLTLTASVSASLKYGSTTTATYSSSRSLGVGAVPNLTGTLAFETSTTTACNVNASTGVVTMNRASGTCSVRVSLINDTNYVDTSSALVSITPALADALVIAAGSATATYSGSAAAITPSYSISGLKFSDTVTVTYGYSGTSNAGTSYSLSATKPTAAGVYSIIPTISMSNSDSYTAPTSVTNGTLTISRATRTLSPTTYSKTTLKYGESATVTSNLTSPSSNSDGTFLYVVGSGCSINSSTGEITATTYTGFCLETTTVTQGNNFETATATAVTFTLSKADTLTVTTATPSALAYTGTAAAVTPTITVSGLVAGNTATGATFNYSRAPNCASGGTCQVGDTGPGGGKVFYVSGSVINASAGISGGGIYLEMAPASFSKTAYNWCEGSGNPYTTLFGSTATTVGSGAENTKTMIDNCTGGAGVQAANLTLGGQSDWFLPSYGELVEIYSQRSMLGLGTGKYASTYLYWSSTEADTWIASSLVPWAGVGGQNKAQATPYLPIRAFSPTSTIFDSPIASPTNAGKYRITPSALTLSGGVTTDYYLATVYETATLTIDKATQTAFTNHSTLSGVFGSALPILKFGGSGDGAESLETTNGSATGCSLNGILLSATAAGTCSVAATKESSENYSQYDSLFSVYLYYYVPEAAGPVSTMPTQIAISISNGLTINPVVGPIITGIFPSSGPVGTVVTFTGTGFDGVNVIKIGRKDLTSVTGVNSTTVTGVIPAGAATGPIYMANSAGSDFNAGGFTVTAP